jgi:flagellar protein FliL
MADKPKTEEEVEVAPAGGKKKLILIITGALLLVGISVGVTLTLLGGNDSADTPEMKMEDTGPTKGDAIYFDLKPFTVNLSADDPVGFLQVQVQVLTYYFEVSELLEKHRPLIRNNLTLLFAKQNSADLRSAEGKQVLQKKVLETIQSVIDKYGKGGEVDNVFFTNFVMQ